MTKWTTTFVECNFKGIDDESHINTINLTIMCKKTVNNNGINNEWHQLKTYIANIIIDINNKIRNKKQNIYEILFRVNLLTFGDENSLFDIKQSLNEYNWGNHNVLINNILYDIDDINITNTNQTTTASSFNITIITFDNQNINTYYNLNDPPINDLYKLSLVQSIIPNNNEHINPNLGICCFYCFYCFSL